MLAQEKKEMGTTRAALHPKTGYWYGPGVVLSAESSNDDKVKEQENENVLHDSQESPNPDGQQQCTGKNEKSNPHGPPQGQDHNNAQAT